MKQRGFFGIAVVVVLRTKALKALEFVGGMGAEAWLVWGASALLAYLTVRFLIAAW